MDLSSYVFTQEDANKANKIICDAIKQEASDQILNLTNDIEVKAKEGFIEENIISGEDKYIDNTIDLSYDFEDNCKPLIKRYLLSSIGKQEFKDIMTMDDYGQYNLRLFEVYKEKESVQQERKVMTGFLIKKEVSEFYTTETSFFKIKTNKYSQMYLDELNRLARKENIKISFRIECPFTINNKDCLLKMDISEKKEISPILDVKIKSKDIEPTLVYSIDISKEHIEEAEPAIISYEQKEEDVKKTIHLPLISEEQLGEIIIMYATIDSKEEALSKVQSYLNCVRPQAEAYYSIAGAYQDATADIGVKFDSRDKNLNKVEKIIKQLLKTKQETISEQNKINTLNQLSQLYKCSIDDVKELYETGIAYYSQIKDL